uniref:Uncharacterized protein n=1 Tax=Hordeum vulgare subsp. vulgare TaxID=112509 RepID=A0A8I7BB14_HORVV
MRMQSVRQSACVVASSSMQGDEHECNGIVGSLYLNLLTTSFLWHFNISQQRKLIPVIIVWIFIPCSVQRLK